MSTLSDQAHTVVSNYVSMRINAVYVNCPYFNNRITRLRAALRVMVGKGTPTEIAEEVRVLAHKERVALADFSEDQLKRYLIDHNIGIECSGFVFHTLDAEVRSRKLGTLGRVLCIPSRSLLRKIIVRFRVAENTNVSVFADDANSKCITTAEATAGDMIIVRGAGTGADSDHMMLITDVVQNPRSCIISYAHSFDDKISRLSGGVRRGTITLHKNSTDIIDGSWCELENTNPPILTHLKSASRLEIRRLHILS